MKKKLFLTALVVAVAIACLALTACLPKVTGGDANMANDYNASEVNAKIDEMRTNGGFRLTFEGKADSEEGTEKVSYVYAANNDLYYYAVDGEQTYFDLTNDDYAVEYHKNGDEDWTKVVTYYDSSFTKENEKQNIRTGAEGMFNWMLFYDDEENTENTGGMAKETGEVAGRSCDKYSWGMSFMGVNVTYACWIDKATGICLRWYASASAFGQGGGANFECKSFDTSYTFDAMPEVSEERTTINNEPANGNTSSLSADYPNYKNAIRSLIAEGVEAEFEITANGEEAYVLTFAAKDDLFYVFDGTTGAEVYADLTDETKYVLYGRDDPQDEWEVEEHTYGENSEEFANKEELVASFEKNLEGTYELIKNAGDAQLKKESTTYLGREVFKYSGEVSYGVGKATINVYVDKATGMVLFDSVGANGALNVSGSVECKSFKLGDDVTITLPEVNRVSILADYPNIKKALRALQDEGVQICMKMTPADEEESPYEILLVYKENMLYQYDGRTKEEIYADVSDRTNCALYQKEEEGFWRIDDHGYGADEIYTMFESPIEGLYSFPIVLSGGDVWSNAKTSKESGKYLERDVDIYVTSIGDETRMAKSYTFYVDKETGVILYCSASMSGLYNATEKWECISFRLKDNIFYVLPEAETNPNRTNKCLGDDYPNYRTAYRDRIETGVEVQLTVSSSMSDPHTFTFAGKGNVIYLYNGRTGEEVYADVSGDETYILYTRADENEEWTISEQTYGAEGARFKSKNDPYMEGQIETLNVLADMSGIKGSEIIRTKEIGTFIDREVVIYTVMLPEKVMNQLIEETKQAYTQLGMELPEDYDEYKDSSETCITYADAETGAVLYFNMVVTGSVEESETWEVTSFKLGDDVTVTLPVETAGLGD